MKIVIGSESFYPTVSGVAVMAQSLAEHFSGLGHEVTVFAPSLDLQTHIDHSFHSYEVRRLRSFPNPFRRGLRVAFMPKKVISEAIAQIKPDVIHLHDPAAISQQLIKAGHKYGIPVVMTNHFNFHFIDSYLKPIRPMDKPITVFLKHYFSNLYNRCECITCPTHTTLEDLSTWGVKVPLKVISNGIELDRFKGDFSRQELLKKYNLPTDEPVVLYIGRIDKDKRMDLFIRAIPLILKKHPAHFAIVGGGTEVEGLKKLASKLGVAEAISWLGWIDQKHPDFTKLYRSATIFGIPSPIETQSIVTMEALASGLPVVGADKAGVAELVKDGYNGRSFHSGQVHDYADKVVDLLKSEKKRQEMSKNALLFMKQHRREETVKHFLDLYEEVIKSYKKS